MFIIAFIFAASAVVTTTALLTPSTTPHLARGRGFWPPQPDNVITISPSGLKGYYLLGIAAYLRHNYDLSKYVFSGASSGAWISLIRHIAAAIIN